jgi:hypothetical protein
MTNPKTPAQRITCQKEKPQMHDTLQRHLGKRALDSELRTRYQSSKKPVPLARQACNIWTWPTKLLL